MPKPTVAKGEHKPRVRRYLVSEKTQAMRCWIVEASSKAEAIRKAKDGESIEDWATDSFPVTRLRADAYKSLDGLRLHRLFTPLSPVQEATDA